MESIESTLVRMLVMKISVLEDAVRFLEQKVLELRELLDVNKTFHVEDITPLKPQLEWEFSTPKK